MIVGDRVNGIEAKLNKRSGFEGLSISIKVNDVKEDGDRLVFDYTYRVDYTKDVGYIQINGEMFAQEDEELTKKILDGWKKNNRIIDEYDERLLNAINYAASAHSVIVARVLSFAPPIIPPRFRKSK